MHCGRDECHDQDIMKLFSLRLADLSPPRPNWRWRGSVAALAALMSCMNFETQQRKWIFQASGAGANETGAQHGLPLQDRWIEFQSQETGDAVKLHAL